MKVKIEIDATNLQDVEDTLVQTIQRIQGGDYTFAPGEAYDLLNGEGEVKGRLDFKALPVETLTVRIEAIMKDKALNLSKLENNPRNVGRSPARLIAEELIKNA